MGCGCSKGKAAVKFQVTMKDGGTKVVETRQKAIALVRQNPGAIWKQLPR